jgi:hypothetical protein
MATRIVSNGGLEVVGSDSVVEKVADASETEQLGGARAGLELSTMGAPKTASNASWARAWRIFLIVT